jgi:hypothetical protein
MRFKADVGETTHRPVQGSEIEPGPRDRKISDF